MTTTTTDHLDHLLKRLHLANARRVWRDLCQRAETEQWSFEAFTRVLVEEEVAHRSNTRVQRLARKADLPYLKTIDEFDFTHQSTLRLQMMGSFLSPDFVSEGRNLVLSGKTGRGKTHLATAIAYRAIQNGFEALFTTCAALVDDLSSAASNKRGFKEALTRYTHPDLLVVDEVGYLTYAEDAANVLFHVVNDRHLKRQSMVFTTNKAFSSWGAVLHDNDLAQAILDRVFERGRHIKLDGPSIRTLHLDGVLPMEDTQQLRVSGTAGSEFPEPTSVMPGLMKLVQDPWLRTGEECQRRLYSCVTRHEHQTHPFGGLGCRTGAACGFSAASGERARASVCRLARRQPRHRLRRRRLRRRRRPRRLHGGA